MKAIDEIEHACPPEIVHFRQFLEETEFMLPTPEELSSPGKAIPGEMFKQPETKPDLPDTKALPGIADVSF